jgi:hypothetical protein
LDAGTGRRDARGFARRLQLSCTRPGLFLRRICRLSPEPVDEVRALLEAAVAFGVLSAAEQQQADALADRICAMTYRLRQRWA